MEFNKEYLPVKCTSIECPFFGECAILQTEVVRARDDKDIDIMLVGQGAGEKEHLTHHPFTGPAGKVLRCKLLPRMKEKKLNIALDNTIRSRPLNEKGKNRAPTAEEIKHCLPYLWDRIEELQPAVIITLGASASGDMIASAKGKPISSVRGRKFNVRGYIFIPTIHPAAILHSRNPDTVQDYHAKIESDLDLAITQIQHQLRLI